MTEETFWHGSKILARFEPKNRKTLRPCMTPLIGRVFEYEWMGTSEDDEPYPGQTRWAITRKHDAEIPDECRGRWCPREDLVIVSDI
jgi:hypothetical protein